MPLERIQVLAAGRVPDLNRPIGTGRGQPATVGTEGHDPGRVAIHRARVQLLAAGRVPDLDRLTGTRRPPPLAVGTHAHALAGMPLERAQLPTAGRVPNLDRP